MKAEQLANNIATGFMS